jgi:hypothetical protein
MADVSSGKFDAAPERGNGNKWYGSSNVIRYLFYLVFLSILGWSTYVFGVATSANEKATTALANDKVHDERMSRFKEDLNEIKTDQKEILRRLPK